MRVIRTAPLSLACVAAAALLLTGCETTDMKMGAPGAKTMATGSAAGGATDGASSQLERCAAPLGTVSLTENQQAGWYTILRNEYRLPPTANLLRLLVQQSNCFIVVERGAAGMNAMTRERALMQSGEMRQGSNMGAGQMVASDYGMEPEIIFRNNNAGGVAGSLGGAIGGRYSGLLGALGGSMNTKEASTMLTLIDNRSGVQVAASEGSASKTDFGAVGQLFGGSGGGSLGGYSNTAEGKVISAAFMDAFNQMVRALRSYKAQSVQGQGLGGGGRLGVDGAAAPSQTSAPGGRSGPAGGSMSMRDAQAKLNELGYNVGTPDGAAGGRTTAGLRAFQRDRGIASTGRLDAATMNELSK
ncbi:peptidoglycan-binding domain-containing protein [Xylophilus sp. Leaf220]|uniref:peptidoglycan-binding domain-containing protein n=1 Tax=Xylophilus sp. Leaf220 TaxID=1735686 RepID=UPI0006F67C8D|nr:peptidoglycan-binding domain-containing protein [Xylophilus sp. Leaf220]KQM77381.1 peptidoglycan-binding protein [Xylophilus sp. Leaf220]